MEIILKLLSNKKNYKKEKKNKILHFNILKDKYFTSFFIFLYFYKFAKFNN